MYTDLTAYPWVLPIVPYETTAELLASLAEQVIGPSERRLKWKESRQRLSLE
jgi:hypothetical protein